MAISQRLVKDSHGRRPDTLNFNKQDGMAPVIDNPMGTDLSTFLRDSVPVASLTMA